MNNKLRTTHAHQSMGKIPDPINTRTSILYSIHVNHGIEFISETTRSWYAEHSIEIQITIPYSLS